LVLFNDGNGNDILAFKTSQENEEGEDGASNHTKMFEFNQYELL